MKYPTFLQAIVLIILWGFVAGMLELTAVAGIGTGIIQLWFLYGWFVDGPGFAWGDLKKPRTFYEQDL